MLCVGVTCAACDSAKCSVLNDLKFVGVGVGDDGGPDCVGVF